MASGEIVGLILTVGLLGVVAGIAVTAASAVRRGRATELRIRQVDAYASWLAAWTTLSRASMSFVAAFRALAAERRDADYFSLRCEEAQRARAAWCDAIRDLDRTEALLIAWSEDPSIREQLARFERVPPDVLRAAIDGDSSGVDEFARRFREADDRAVALLCTATAKTRSHQPAARKLAARAATYAETIIDRWSKAPDRE